MAKKARYRVRQTGPYEVTYEDELGTVTLGSEVHLEPTGRAIAVAEIPPDFHLSRDELIERISRKSSWWTGTYTFFDERGRQVIPPSQRGPEGNEFY